MKHLYRSALFVCLMLILASLPAQAQVSGTSSSTDGSTPSALQKGTPPLGSYGGSNFDQVNLFNGNLSMRFPLATLSGRGGMGGSVVLSYNSKTWHTEEVTLSGGQKLYYPFYDGWDRKEQTIAPGFLLHAGRLVGRRVGWGPINQCPLPNDPNTKVPRYAISLTTLTFTAPDGTEYQMRDGFRFDANGQEDGTDGRPFTVVGCDPGQSRGIWFHTADGTAATFQSGTFTDNDVEKPFTPVEIRDVTEVGGEPQFYPSGIVMLRDGTRFYVVNGQVLKQRDRNGNVMRYEYKDKGRLTRIVDTLGRDITIAYNRLTIIVSAPGVGGVRREIRILRGTMSTALHTGAAIRTYSQLFGDYLPDFSFGYENEFNPLVVTAVTLPTGHRWDFKYNDYGEVARVVTPSLGAIEYDYAREQGPYPPSGGPQIFRRVAERRTYPNAGSSQIEGKTGYSDPSLKNPDGSSPPVTEKHFNAGNQLLAETRHWFSGSPLDNYSKFYGVPRNSGYRPWLEGKELRTAEIESGQERRVTEYVWEQRAAVGWLGLTRDDLNQPENDPRLVTVRTKWTDSQQVTESRTEYDEYTNVTRETVTDFGINAPGGTILREMRRTYLKTNPFTGKHYPSDIGIHLRSLVETETVMGSAGTETVSRTEYDNYTTALLGRTLTGAAATTHDSTTYSTDRKTRGNVTSVTAGFGSADAAESFIQYDVLGNPVKMIGPPNVSGLALTVETEYQAQNNGADFFAFPIRTIRRQITQGGGGRLDLTTGQTFDFQTGLVVAETGYHPEQVTTYEYNDLLDRLTRVRPAGLGEMKYSYSDAGAPTFVKMEREFEPATFTFATTFYDGLLKPTKTERSDAAGVVTTETTYDGLGRPVTVTNPHRGGGEPTDGTAETTYDMLSRMLTITTRDALGQSTGTVTTAYTGSTVTVRDQAGKQRRSAADALGRVREVVEPDMTGGLTVATQYGYDGRGNLLTVNQSGQGRTFSYDTLGRLRTAKTPESGLTRYDYDRASNLTRRADARNVGTFYLYDELGRVTSKVYTDGTPRVGYFYDEALPATVPPNFTRGFSRGRLVATVTFPTGSVGVQPAGTFLGYDVGGRAVQHVQMLDGQFYDSRTSYNPGSQPTGMVYPSQTSVGMEYNPSAQLKRVTRNGATLAEDVTYAATGGVTGQKLGNGLLHTMRYSSRLQPETISLGTTPGGNQRFGLRYDYGLNRDVETPGVTLDRTCNNGNVGRIMIDVPGSPAKEQDFGYDPLNRLKQAREYAESLPVPRLTAINPPESRQGQTIPVMLTGENLSNTSALNFSPNTGITVSGLTSTATSITAMLTIAADAPIGARNVTATTPLGVTNALTFAVTVGGGGVPCGEVTPGSASGDASIYTNTGPGSGLYGVSAGSTTKNTMAGSATLNVSANAGDMVTLSSAWVLTLTNLSPNQRTEVTFRWVVNGTEAFTRTLYAVTNEQGVITDTNGSGLGGVQTAWSETSPGQTLAQTTVTVVGPFEVRYEISGQCVSGCSGVTFPFFGFNSNGGMTADCTGGRTPGGNGKKARKRVGPKQAQPLSWSQDYDYDVFGNLTGVTRNKQKESIAVNAATNQLKAEGMGYDLAGNLVQDGAKIYTYDAENRMLTATVGGAVTRYAYDGDGARIKKVVTANGTDAVTRFVYGPGGLLAEHEGATAAPATPTREYFSGATGMLAVVEGTEFRYAMPDHLGSPRIFTDAAGNVVSRRDFYPFGDEIPVGIGGRTTAQGYGFNEKVRKKFTGYEHDEETGLDYAGARYYANTMGRFHSPDPLPMTTENFVNPQRMNLYAYVNNNPLAAVDVDGQQGQGKGGDKVINIFLTFAANERNTTTKGGTEKAPNYASLMKLAQKKGYDVNVYGSSEVTGLSTGTALPLSVSGEALEGSLNNEVTSVVGHGSFDPDLGGNNPNGFLQNNLRIGDENTVGTMYATPNGTTSETLVGPMTGPKPEVSGAVVCSFTCDSNTNTGNYFTFTGKNQSLVTVNSGKNGVTAVGTLEKANFAFIKTYIATKGNVAAATKAANAVIARDRKVKDQFKNQLNVGDKVKTKKVS